MSVVHVNYYRILTFFSFLLNPAPRTKKTTRLITRNAKRTNVERGRKVWGFVSECPTTKSKRRFDTGEKNTDRKKNKTEVFVGVLHGVVRIKLIYFIIDDSRRTAVL